MASLGAQKVIALAASTGGVEALTQVISSFPSTIPPVVILLHIPVGFTKIYAARLGKLCKATVKEAASGDTLMPGQVLIAPAGKHTKLVRHQNRLALDCFDGDRVNGVIPSADVLFDSVAEVLRTNAIGAILTGLGADGAAGLLKMRNNGAKTIGQDRATSAVYGMPKVAKEMGAVEYELPLNQIADKILSLI